MQNHSSPGPAAEPTPPPTAAAPSAAAGAEGGDYTGVVHSFYGSVLDRATMGRCQAILQLSFNRDPDRLGYYIPLDPSELLAGEEREAKIDELFATAKRRGERWHLAYDADGARALPTPRPAPTSREAQPNPGPEPLTGADGHPPLLGAGEVAALATTFPHTMRLADGSLRQILALGEVATHPDYRGRRHGVAAVEVCDDTNTTAAC